jgi:hypothetical protein
VEVSVLSALGEADTPDGESTDDGTIKSSRFIASSSSMRSADSCLPGVLWTETD